MADGEMPVMVYVPGMMKTAGTGTGTGTGTGVGGRTTLYVAAQPVLVVMEMEPDVERDKLDMPPLSPKLMAVLDTMVPALHVQPAAVMTPTEVTAVPETEYALAHW